MNEWKSIKSWNFSTNTLSRPFNTGTKDLISVLPWSYKAQVLSTNSQVGGSIKELSIHLKKIAQGTLSSK